MKKNAPYQTTCLLVSLRASSPIWASEASLARTRERAAKPRGAGERPQNRRACSQATFWCTYTTYMVPVSLLKQSNAQYPEKVYLIKSLSKGMGLPTSPPHPPQGFTLVDAYKQLRLLGKSKVPRLCLKHWTPTIIIKC